ncbi:MAG: LPXTG-motif cell wall anchor domain protein [Candidatus Amesbacteria bacterium GW2011_GWA2_47_70]|nr:MAG: LPXTG-motif cell wall anchor domain protein [Candidatus Amesbacteria bacterium GW2011_GWA2_47_70]
MKWWGIALLPFFFCPLKIYASIGINEFQVEPSGSSQWIELYNSGPDSQDISGWFIDDDGGTTKFTIPTNTVLTPNACMSFQSGSFFWNTASGDKARLLSGDTIIDEYQYSSSPGNNVSFGRLPDGTGGWTTFSNPSRDKLNNTNTSCLSLPTPSPSSTPLSTPLQTPAVSPTPTPNDYSNLSISEYLPYPDSGNEWVEIYNGNDSEVNLYGWFVDDVADGGSAPIGISGTISAKTYKQFYLSDSFLNNSGDDVRLLNGSKIEKNKTSFSASTKAKSWSKDSSGNWCQIDPTPNSSNPSCPTLTSAPSPSASTGTNTPKPSPTPKSSSDRSLFFHPTQHQFPSHRPDRRRRDCLYRLRRPYNQRVCPSAAGLNIGYPLWPGQFSFSPFPLNPRSPPTKFTGRTSLSKNLPTSSFTLSWRY